MATVSRMADYRLVFVLDSTTGTVVFLATHTFGRGDRRAHQMDFGSRPEAVKYAQQLASHIGCDICGLNEAELGGGCSEDTAHG